MWCEFRHILLFDYELFDKICDKSKYLTSEKSDITDSVNHNFGEIRIDSYNSLPTEKILTFHNVMILIKSVVNKNKNEYIWNTFHEYINTHNVFLEKGSCKDKSYTQYF